MVQRNGQYWIELGMSVIGSASAAAGPDFQSARVPVVIGGTPVSPREVEGSEGEGGAEEMVALPVAVRRSWQEPTSLER